MAILALIKNNVVTQTIVVDADVVKIITDKGGIGDIHDPVTGELTRPPEIAPVKDDPDVTRTDVTLNDIAG